MAIMTGLVQGLQWALGIGNDRVSACFLSAQFTDVGAAQCDCREVNAKPRIWKLLWGSFLIMNKHRMETFLTLTFLQRDIIKRTRVLDTILRRLVKHRNIDQVVMLGSGFDTRPYREGAGLQGVRKIFETDVFNDLNLKKHLLVDCHIRPVGDHAQVSYMRLNLAEPEPFHQLWKHEDFLANGTTVVVCEHVFGYIDIFTNMNWIHQLRDIAVRAGGKVALVIMATRGPYFDEPLFPRCYNPLECIRTQMPPAPAKIETLMEALGWQHDPHYMEIERQYFNTWQSFQDYGFVGIYNIMERL